MIFPSNFYWDQNISEMGPSTLTQFLPEIDIGALSEKTIEKEEVPNNHLKYL